LKFVVAHARLYTLRLVQFDVRTYTRLLRSPGNSTTLNFSYGYCYSFNAAAGQSIQETSRRGGCERVLGRCRWARSPP